MNIFTILLIQPLANGLALFYRLLGENMGLAIIGFSLALRIVLTPLTKPYMESMKKMKKYQKDLEKLKRKHGSDKAKLIKAQSDFYKEKGINPGAGCFPYLLQIVILIALFRMFTSVLSASGNPGEQFNSLLYEPLKYSGDFYLNTKFLYLDITKPDTFSLPGVPFGLPGPFILGAAIVQLLTAKMTMPYVEDEKKIAKKTKEKEDDFAIAMQSSMIYMFPLITVIAGMSFPSGLAIYWFLFSAYQAFVQYRATGWGGATAWIKSLGLVKSETKHGKAENN